MGKGNGEDGASAGGLPQAHDTAAHDTAAHDTGGHDTGGHVTASHVVVVGGGPTGAVAALCAADAGFATALLAPRPQHDARTTALLMPAVSLLTHLGVWPRVQGEAAPLATMRLVDDTGRMPRGPEIAFDAAELDLDAFGYNVPNDALNRALSERLDEADVTRVTASATALSAGTPARVSAGDASVRADLVVAADGAHSLVRQEAGLDVKRWRYDQSAFVTTLSHERPHGNASTEFHKASGPFTLVPLPGHRSSLVWVGRPDEVARWAAADPGPLAREIERRAHFILGRVSVDGPRGVVPMEGMIARHFGRGGIVLVGEAAHRFPPIGAQGLNLGLRDAAVLHRLLAEARATGALTGVADAYDRRRRVDVAARTIGVDLLNRSLLTEAPPVAALRAAAMTAARNVGPLRRAMMRAGLG